MQEVRSSFLGRCRPPCGLALVVALSSSHAFCGVVQQKRAARFALVDHYLWGSVLGLSLVVSG